MDDRNRLRELVARTPCLLVDADRTEAELVTRTAAAARVTIGQSMLFIVDLASALEVFERHSLGNDEFELTTLAKIAGHPRSTLDSWSRMGILPPSVREAQGAGPDSARVYSFADGFCAAIAGSLRRHRTPLPTVEKAVALIRKQVGQPDPIVQPEHSYAERGPK